MSNATEFSTEKTGFLARSVISSSYLTTSAGQTMSKDKPRTEFKSAVRQIRFLKVGSRSLVLASNASRVFRNVSFIPYNNWLYNAVGHGS